MIKISLITDEISADPQTAIELGAAWGVHSFELRGFYTDRVPCFSAYQKQKIRDILEDYQAQIIAISPGLFKMALPPVRSPRETLGWMDYIRYESWSAAQNSVRYHLEELLPKSLDYASELGAGKVAIFGFDRAGAPPGDPPEEVLKILRLAAERARAAGLELVLENEAGFWADTGERTASLVRAIGNPNLGINWDPGNAFFAGDRPFPEGYASVKGLVRHVHFKDATCEPGGQPQFVGQGQINWAGQVQALKTDGYDGYISIETHIAPKVAAARSALERLQSLLSA
ncbi:MAG: sugar phosphate isomerase/epimerase family protein [Omnitrophica WOR_2 bacterium]